MERRVLRFGEYRLILGNPPSKDANVSLFSRDE